MTISSSLNAGVMGLNVNATRLATISDNIANSATIGYKRSDVDFSSLVIGQRASSYSAGGVRAESYKEITTQGTLISTGRSTDIAINGNGMLPVTNLSGTTQNANDRDFMLTPTGGFSADENGFLRTTNGLFLLGWPTDIHGEAISANRGSTTALEPVNINVGQYKSSPTGNVSLGLNLPAEINGILEPFSLPVEYYDSLGIAQTLEYQFLPTAGTPNSWDVSVSDSASNTTAPIADFQVEFDISEALGGSVLNVTPGTATTYDAINGTIIFDIPNGQIETFVGKIGSTNGMSQLGTNFSPYNIGKDGSPVGDLQSVEVSPQGYLEAIYNTGFRRTLYQIPVGDVPNVNGLKALSNQAFSLSPNSGDIYLWDAGDGPTGEYVGYALMESNSDIAGELTSLIETQRAYSSNAKIIQTVDEMLQETTNLKR